MRAVFLTGMMGSGKSEVGQALARRLGWAFIDTDSEIVRREGRTIPEIFRTSGEGHFRAVERDVLRAVTRRPHMIVATGGGAVLSAASRRVMRRSGPVVYLRAPVDVLLARLGDDPGRPLLGDDPRAALDRLYAERVALYEEDSLAVDASRPPDVVVDDVLKVIASSQRHTVRVRLGARSYAVHIGAGILSLVGFDLREIGAGRRVLVVTQRGLIRRFADAVGAALEGCGFTAHVVTAPVGEGAKTLRQASRLIDTCATSGLGRDDTIIALGGGVIGDLAGFVAGTYMRGIRLLQIPTTLLAQIDSSIGGKAAVNHPRAKNLIGVVHQPSLVVADVETLRSLPVRERRAGLAEAVKYAMTLDAGLLEWLERDRSPREWSGQDLVEVVFRCAALKAGIVEVDELERGPREVLNYGHTVGHAIETAHPGKFVHGEAIAIGMNVEAEIAVRVGLLPREAAQRQGAMLRRLGLPTEVPQGTTEPILEAMRLDKKRRDGRIRCSLPEGIGRARVGVDVPEALMQEVVRACQGSS